MGFPRKLMQDPETGEWMTVFDPSDLRRALERTGHSHERDRITMKTLIETYERARLQPAKDTLQRAMKEFPCFDRLVGLPDEGRTDKDREILNRVVRQLARAALHPTRPPERRGRYHTQTILRKIRLRETLRCKVQNEDPDLANALSRSIERMTFKLAMKNEADLFELRLAWAANTFRRLIRSYRINTICRAFRKRGVNRSYLKRAIARWEPRSLDQFFTTIQEHHMADFTLPKSRRKS